MNDVFQISSALSTEAQDKFWSRVLKASPELSQRRLATVRGASLGGADYALRTVADQGFPKARNLRKLNDKATFLHGLKLQGAAEKASIATAFFGGELDGCEVLRQNEGLKSEVCSRGFSGGG